MTICVGKSTYARCGIIVNVTPFEPEWEGYATLEISNTTPLPAKIYANEGIAQIIFLESDEEFYTPASADDLLTRYREPYVGLRLPRTSLEKIYATNFRRLWGKSPREIDIGAAISTCEREGNTVMAEALGKLR